MPRYALNVWCSRDGVSREAGTHATCEAKNETEARRKLLPELMWLEKFYDRVTWTVNEVKES